MTQGRDDEEQQLRIDQMTVNIEKMRADMATQQTQFAADQAYRDKQMTWEMRKFFVQLFAAFGVAFGGGAATLALILHWTGKL